MQPKHQTFLNAYIEHGRLTGFEDLSTDRESRSSALSAMDKARVISLNETMTACETSLFNRENVKPHLQALSASGQHLERELDLSKESHYRKISAASLAYSDDKQLWQTSSLPMEDKFQAMRLKVSLKCDKPETQTPSLWSRRLGLLRDIAVQGSATAFVGGVGGALAGAPAAGVGSVPGALAGAGYGFFSSALALTAAYAFTPVPETQASEGAINCEVVSLLPEYFIAENVPERLLTQDAKAAKEQAFQIELGQQSLNHLQRLFPCAPEEAKRCQDDSVLQQIGVMLAEDQESTRALLQSILKQQGLVLQGAAEDRQVQKRERERLFVLLTGIDKKLAHMDAQKREAQQAEMQAARVKRAQQAASGLVQIGVQIQSPFLQKIGNLGATLTGLEQALLTTTQSFKALAEGGLGALAGTAGIPGLSAITGAFSFLAGPIGIVTAVLGVFSLFGRRKQNDGLAKALQGISKQIVALHKEMRESFQCTWTMLNEIEQRQYERFELTLKAIDYLGTELTDHIDKLAMSQESMQRQLEANLQQLKQYVAHIANQSMLEAFERAELASDKRMLKHLDDYVAPIHIWLTRTAILDANNGYMLAPDLGSASQDLWIKQLETELAKPALANPLAAPLGFYRNLMVSVMPDFVNELTAGLLITPNEWLPVQQAYVKLIHLHKQGVARAEERAQQHYKETFASLLNITQANLLFMNRLSDERYGQAFIMQLIQRYQNAIATIRQDICAWIENTKQQLNRDFGISHFALDQEILSSGRAFNPIDAAKIELKTAHAGATGQKHVVYKAKRKTVMLRGDITYLAARLTSSKPAKEVLSDFLTAVNKHNSAFSETLTALFNDPRFILAHDISAIELVFNYECVNFIPIPMLMMPVFNVQLTINIKGVPHSLCQAKLTIPTHKPLQNLLPNPLDNHMIEFSHGDVSSISTQIFNTLPSEEVLAKQRKALGQHCLSYMSTIKRHTLELGMIIQWIAPNLMSKVAMLQGISMIELSMQQLVEQPKALQLQVLMKLLSSYNWAQMLGVVAVSTTDAAMEFSQQVQTVAKSHALIPELTRAVHELQTLCEVAPSWIEANQSTSDELILPSISVTSLSHTFGKWELLNETLRTNTAEYVYFEALASELTKIKEQSQNLVMRNILPREHLDYIAEESNKVSYQLSRLAETANNIYAKQRQLFESKSESCETLAPVASLLTHLGWMASSSRGLADESHVNLHQDTTLATIAKSTDSVDSSDCLLLQAVVHDEIQQKIMSAAKAAHINLAHTMLLINQVWHEFAKQAHDLASAGIMFLGETRKGKTTLINHLLGTLYRLADFDPSHIQIGLVAAGGEPERTKTSDSMHSETFGITIHHSRVGCLIDTPGSTDNRDVMDESHISAYDVAAAVGFQLLGAKLPAFKGMVIVVEMGDLIQANIEAILKPFRKIARLLGKNISSILPNTMLVVTKKELIAPCFSSVSPSSYLSRYRDNILKTISVADERDIIDAMLSHFMTHPSQIVMSDLTDKDYSTQLAFQTFFSSVEPIASTLFNFEAYSKELEVFAELVSVIETILNQYMKTVGMAEQILLKSQERIHTLSASLDREKSGLNLQVWSEILTALDAEGYQCDNLQRRLDFAKQELIVAKGLCEPMIAVRDALLLSRDISQKVVVPHASLYQASVDDEAEISILLGSKSLM